MSPFNGYLNINKGNFLFLKEWIDGTKLYCFFIRKVSSTLSKFHDSM